MKIKATISSNPSKPIILDERTTERYILDLSGGGLTVDSTILAMSRMRELREKKMLEIVTKKITFTFQVLD